MTFRDQIAADMAATMNPEEFGVMVVANGRTFPAVYMAFQAEAFGVVGSSPALRLDPGNAPEIKAGDLLAVEGVGQFTAKGNPQPITEFESEVELFKEA